MKDTWIIRSTSPWPLPAASAHAVDDEYDDYDEEDYLDDDYDYDDGLDYEDIDE